MTTVTAPTVTPAIGNRILAVVRLHLTNKWTVIYLPWLIMLAILVLNVAIWAVVLSAAAPENREEVRQNLGYSGAASYMFVYMMVIAVQAISITFRFAQGYSVTRRDYYLGTALTFVGFSAMYAVGLSLLAAIEELTDGWGLGGALFTSSVFGDGGWLPRAFIFFVLSLFFFFVGAAVAAIWVRWRATGLTTFFVALAFALVGLGALVTFTNSWAAVGEWFVGTGYIGVYAWSLVPTAVAAVGGYLVLRRATPQG